MPVERQFGDNLRLQNGPGLALCRISIALSTRHFNGRLTSRFQHRVQRYRGLCESPGPSSQPAGCRGCLLQDGQVTRRVRSLLLPVSVQVDNLLNCFQPLGRHSECRAGGGFKQHKRTSCAGSDQTPSSVMSMLKARSIYANTFRV